MLFSVVLKITKEVIVIFESLEPLPDFFLHLLVLEFHAIFRLVIVRLATPVLIRILVLELLVISRITKEQPVVLLPHIWIREDGIRLGNLLEQLL